MKKPSSYQKMKQKYEAEISMLRSDIDVLIGDDVVKQVSVSMKYRMQNQFEKMGWTDFKVRKASKDAFNGIIPQMHVLDEVGQNPTLNKP